LGLGDNLLNPNLGNVKIYFANYFLAILCCIVAALPSNRRRFSPLLLVA
jgi:hypothetical protein